MLASLAKQLSLDINQDNLAIRRAQIRTRLDEYVLMVASQMALAILMVWLMWNKVAHTTLLSWLGLLYSAHALEMFFWWRHRLHTNEVSECQRWRNYFVIFTSLVGLIMGSAGIVMFVPNDLAYQALLICIMFALAAASVTVNPVYPASMYLYTLLLLLPLLFSLLRGNDTVHLVLTGMTLLYLTFILHSGHGLARTFGLSLQRSEENVELVLQLISEKKTANAARLIAEQSNQSKSKFLAAASHDLRQPMHALSLFVESLKSHISDRSGMAILRQVEHSVDVLGQMLDALLDVSRLDSGAIAPRYIQFSVQDLFTQMRDEFAATAHQKNLHWRVVPCASSVYSDPLLLERILRNLLSNALHYTVQGEVSLRAYVIDSVLQIEVADTGIGIAEEHLPQIFDEYFQVGNEQRDRKQGLGLGLAIVQRLSQLLQCQLQVESKLGVGTRFSLQVPLQQPDVIIKVTKNSN